MPRQIEKPASKRSRRRCKRKEMDGNRVPSRLRAFTPNFGLGSRTKTGALAPTGPVTGNAANGKALYYSYSCYACHGYNGETGRAFVGNWSSNLATEENFIRFLRGRANVA